MFRFEATADHLPAFELERVLERCAWTDLIHIVVDGNEVYRDDTGLETDLVPALDVLENVALPLWIAGEDPSSREAEHRELLELVGLAHRAHHHPSELSGGELQRVTLARALVTRPPLLLADEPTGALDTRNAAMVMEIFDELQADDRAVVIVTHDLEIAERMVERTPGITRLLDRIEKKGLVQRSRSPQDRRQVMCIITRAGLALLKRLDDPVDELDGKALEPLTEFQLTGLHNGMTLTGSAVMALALTEVPARAEELWTAAHLDEDWQIELWGKDEEEAERRALREAEFLKTAEFIALLG